ncbi:Hypothetical Protein FCC1311_102402 [Hondaea fermentalgiana]|uniref:Transmembrane protein 145 n=1 Tax=Hondaea fermentalgiana TaxID=2315210 RepID=A0A2R5GT18_9STRA|nr:Hypothetical Protein FCC1311_102402 [Hondaea fermentalgiana]|eukprot:GBG34017.1 Hypothetical Protein FCC1311_102402 [Hondaea fermentalgiana]
MDEITWLRLFGFFMLFVLAPDVVGTVRGVRSRKERLRIGIMLALLPILNAVSMMLLIYRVELCGVFINLLALAYYGAKVLVGYLYTFRAELAVEGLQDSSWNNRLVIYGVQLYLVMTFVLNLGKAIVNYRSYLDESGQCAVDFGEGLWVILDEIMFFAQDLFTFSMLLYMYYQSPVLQGSASREAIRRVLVISGAPLFSTILTTAQLLIDPTTGIYISTIDFQVHVICLFIVYAGVRREISIKDPHAKINPRMQAYDESNSNHAHTSWATQSTETK